MRQIKQDVKELSFIRRKKRRFLYLISTVTSIFILSGGIFLFFSDNFKIKNVVVVGAKDHEEASQIQYKVLDIIERDILGFLPANNRFIYPKDQISTALNSLPDIYESDINVDSSGDLITTLKKREPYGVFCVKDASLFENCFYFDKTGYVFRVAEQLAKSIYVEWIIDSASQNLIGQQIIEPKAIIFFETSQKILVSMGYPVKTVVLNKNELSLITYAGFSVRFDIADNIDVVSGFLNSVLSSPELSKESQNNRGGLQYIDLRFGNKIYYKFSTQ